MPRSNMLSAFALACLPMVLAVVPAGEAGAATITVNNCNDSGVGSLRDAVARAVSGDTIIVRTRGCSRISLTHGPIAIAANDLTLIGPGRAFTIHGGDASQVLMHAGTGVLRLKALSITHGRIEAPQAFGGCIYSAGDVQLKDVAVNHCVAQGIGTGSADNVAGGGGIYAQRNVLLTSSAVYTNSVLFDPGLGHGSADGGGVMAKARVSVTSSDIFQNSALGNGGGAAAKSLSALYANINNNHANHGGGYAGIGFSPFDANSVVHSTIAFNRADDSVGGADLRRGPTLILDSTISSNAASLLSGVTLNLDDPKPAMVISSTIAFNHERRGDACQGAMDWGTQETPLQMQSSIVADNTCGTYTFNYDITIDDHTGLLEGSHNFIGHAHPHLPLPPDTMSGDPRLAPIADNGGPTRTHALLPDSPAIDAGNNDGGLGYDQRGAGFPRVKGTQADIGAFER